MKILRDIENLAVDANPIVSAIIGGSARAIFLKAEHISFYTTAFNFKEVEKYIPVLSSNKDIPLDDLYLALSTLPIIVCSTEFYKDKIKKAKGIIGQRDPDDVYLLALSRKLKCPIWSNDRDFDNLGVKVFTTLDLMKKMRKH